MPKTGCVWKECDKKFSYLDAYVLQLAHKLIENICSILLSTSVLGYWITFVDWALPWKNA